VPPAGAAATQPLRALPALAAAGFRRWATYRQAAAAGAFTNCVFGLIKVSILLSVAASAGGSVAGYDRAAPARPPERNERDVVPI